MHNSDEILKRYNKPQADSTCLFSMTATCVRNIISPDKGKPTTFDSPGLFSMFVPAFKYKHSHCTFCVGFTATPEKITCRHLCCMGRDSPNLILRNVPFEKSPCVLRRLGRCVEPIWGITAFRGRPWPTLEMCLGSKLGLNCCVVGSLVTVIPVR